MTNITSARMAGVLTRIAAAGHRTRRVEIETPDGAPMVLTIIDAGRRRQLAFKHSTEPDQGELIVEREHQAAARSSRRHEEGRWRPIPGR